MNKKQKRMLEPNNPNVFNERQLEKEFGISIHKQRKLRANKNLDGIYALPFFKIGKKVFYQRDAIMEWFSKLQEKEANEIE